MPDSNSSITVALTLPRHVPRVPADVEHGVLLQEEPHQPLLPKPDVVLDVTWGARFCLGVAREASHELAESATLDELGKIFPAVRVEFSICLMGTYEFNSPE